jgi:30S ribosomal protein S31
LHNQFFQYTFGGLILFMGKGDKRTRRGKIFSGSFGKSRPAKTKTQVKVAAVAQPKAEPKKKAARKKKEG